MTANTRRCFRPVARGGPGGRPTPPFRVRSGEPRSRSTIARGPGEPRSLLQFGISASPKAQCVHASEVLQRKRGLAMRSVLGKKLPTHCGDLATGLCFAHVPLMNDHAHCHPSGAIPSQIKAV